MSQELLKQAEQLAREEFGGTSAGHDWWHTARVRDLAVAIGRREGADLLTVEAAALLHDIGDVKFSGSKSAGAKRVARWLRERAMSETFVATVVAIVKGVSYRGAGVPDLPLPLEGMCVRDADRLDALGAIGIARTFAYGGHLGELMHDPAYRPNLHTTESAYRSETSSSVGHFYEKTLLLRDRMGTNTGRIIAERRHAYTEEFLQQFDVEWRAKDVPALESDAPAAINRDMDRTQT